ncbi:MAG: GtrA family protein [Eubacteriales bacterium]|nr:GtrA family protein [Eubacteriales bacterium]
MIEKLKKMINYETVSYLIAGMLTTVVDYVVFAAVNEGMQGHGAFSQSAAVMTATVISWIAAVLFAYVTNKLVVFRNYDFRPSYLAGEAAGFFAARLVSGLITIFLMWLMADHLGWNEYFAKILTSVFNMVFNYAASKLWIFKK